MKISKRIRFPANKKAILIGGLVLFLTGSAFWWLQSDWSKSASSLEEQKAKSQTSAQMVLEADKLSIDTLQSAKTALEEVAGTSCDISPLQSWRRYVTDEVSRREKSCRELASSADDAAQAIGMLLNHLEDESRLAQIVTDTMVAVDNLEPYQYDKAIEVWQQAASAFKAFEAENELKKQSDHLAVSAGSIADSYKALKEADASKKRPSYDEAYIHLQNAYQEFNETSRSVEESYKSQAEAATLALQKL